MARSANATGLISYIGVIRSVSVIHAWQPQ